MYQPSRPHPAANTSPLPAETQVSGVDGPVDGNTVSLPNQRLARVDAPILMLQEVLDSVAAQRQLDRSR